MNNEFDPKWPHGHITPEGFPARIVAVDVKRKAGNALLAVLVDINGTELMHFVHPDGRRADASLGGSLRNAPAPKRKLYFWLLPQISPPWLERSGVWTAEDLAVENRPPAVNGIQPELVEIELDGDLPIFQHKP